MLKRCTTVYNETETWQIVPDYIKKSKSFEEFKLKIKLWNPENCLYRLCKRFLPQVGFLELFMQHILSYLSHIFICQF